MTDFDPATDRVLVALTVAQVNLLLDAIDSHEYERAPESATRNSGYIIDPRLECDRRDRPLDAEEQETADFLDEHHEVEKILRAALPDEA